MNKYKHISRVENNISMMLAKAGISKHVFFGSLPASLDNSWTDMILVDVQAISDYDSHAKGSANIFLYAKATDSTSKKAVKQLEEMETKLDTILAEYYDSHYSLEINYRDQGYDENTQFYYNIVNIAITVRNMNNKK